MELELCKFCGCKSYDIVNDECVNCGKRDRIIQSPAGWMVVVPFVFAVALFWWLI